MGSVDAGGGPMRKVGNGCPSATASDARLSHDAERFFVVDVIEVWRGYLYGGEVALVDFI